MADLNSAIAAIVFLDPPHILDKVDFGNGTATVADFDSESSLDKEQRTPETTPRYALVTFPHSFAESNVLSFAFRTSIEPGSLPAMTTAIPTR